jgi:hypothetical protein
MPAGEAIRTRRGGKLTSWDWACVVTVALMIATYPFALWIQRVIANENLPVERRGKQATVPGMVLVALVIFSLFSMYTCAETHDEERRWLEKVEKR